MDTATKDKIEAAAFRRMLKHLSLRHDVQNIDLMGLSGFCRNCLSDWVQEAASEAGVPLSKDQARAHVYGMPYDDFKDKYQKPASDAQLKAMDESLAINEQVREGTDW